MYIFKKKLKLVTTLNFSWSDLKQRTGTSIYMRFSAYRWGCWDSNGIGHAGNQTVNSHWRHGCCMYQCIKVLNGLTVETVHVELLESLGFLLFIHNINFCTLCNIICTCDSGQSNVIIKHYYVLEFFCLDQIRSCHRYKWINDIEFFLELSLTKLCKMHKNYRKYIKLKEY